MKRLLNKIKSVEVLTEKPGQIIESASKVTKSFVETVSDKETYKNMGNTIKTRLTEDKDGDGVLDKIAKTGYYSPMLIVEKSAELGGVVIYPNSENGFAPETLQAGEYTLLIYGSSNAPIARIVMDIK